MTRTLAELSVVCPQTSVLEGVQAETDWRCIAVAGPLDFSLTGILASLAAPLAAAGIALFALFTYDTSCLLVKDTQVTRAVEVLTEGGHWCRPLGRIGKVTREARQ